MFDRCICLGGAETALCLQDYVKWRGALFHHFLLALVDKDAGVRDLAEHLLTDSLASKVWPHVGSGIVSG